MTVGYTKLPQHFYITTPLPCPYLEGRLERKVITELRGPGSDHLHDVLSHAGFRRSHSVAYIPACTACDACKPVRVMADAFKMKRSLRKIANHNTDLVMHNAAPVATAEQFGLFSRYQRFRHHSGDMARMDFRDYRAMIEDSSVDTYIQEYRLPAPLENAGENSGETAGDLVACCLVDRLRDGFSAVYSFFDPELDRRSLGSFMVLRLIHEARIHELPYVYLGYLVEACRKMNYKTRFRPLEILTGQGWQLYRPGNQ